MTKLALAVALFCAAYTAAAAEAGLEHIRIDSSLLAIERGADTVMTVCHGCHGLKYMRYRDLLELGLDRTKVAGWRGDLPPDAPLVSLLPDDAAMQTFGKIPPDLSLMIKAPENGADYVYSYLLGFYTTPQGTQDNRLFPGTRMPDVLGIGGKNDAGQRAAIQHEAADVIAFLDWVADPHAAERHRLGYYTIAFLVFWTALLYWLKREIWAGIDTG
ncbi:MAG TPA: cytochrome c1 [Gallionella sp.]|nr:cytochrome c1 [Gallionella sp.]